MCLIVFRWQPGAAVPLQVWANRDEFLARPASATAFWPDAPQVLAGRDLAAGGSWMGVTATPWPKLMVQRLRGSQSLTGARMPSLSPTRSMPVR